MKILITLCLFGVLSTFSLVAMADAAVADDVSALAAPVVKAATDAEITLNFFRSLVSCTPGDYKEKNILAAQVGAPWLAHTINGEDKGYCSVMLATPDNRTLECDFSMAELTALSDQHFLVGILTNSYDNPSKETLASDRVWTDLKSKSCGF